MQKKDKDRQGQSSKSALVLAQVATFRSLKFIKNTREII